MPKKKRAFRFYWEKPEKDDLFEPAGKPFEFRFTSPRMAFPEMKIARAIPVNISETAAEIIIRAELPGFKKNEVNLNITENAIEISASKKEQKIEKSEKFYHEERTAGAVRRAFTLPERVDPERAQARLEEGVLTVILPRMETGEKKKKRLEIK